MTRFMVETLTVLLFVLVFRHLPRLRGSLSRLVRAGVSSSPTPSI
jgi:multisubunit Na+/H+ antiporter MnhB subunit